MKKFLLELHGMLLMVAIFAWLVFLPTTGLLYLIGALQ